MDEMSDKKVLDDLMKAVFDTSDLPATRYMWYEPIGHVMIEGGKLFVKDGEEYRPATKEEVGIWNEMATSK